MESLVASPGESLWEAVTQVLERAVLRAGIAILLLLAPIGRAMGAPPAPEGVAIAPGVTVPLPAAKIDFDRDQDAAALGPLAGAIDWERFTADSVSAPVAIAIEPFPADGPRLGHRVHTAFTLHAPLERMRTDETLRRSLDAGDDPQGSQARPLTVEELVEAGIAEPVESDRPVFLDLLLLNRVRVRGVVRATATEHPDGLEVAWEFDPRFAEHPRWQPTWARLEETDLGTRVEGTPQPYGGSGGVVAVRRLATTDGPDLLVVESRMVIGEPEAWFQASNLLRSKIPIITQDGVRTLRRRLAAAR